MTADPYDHSATAAADARDAASAAGESMEAAQHALKESLAAAEKRISETAKVAERMLRDTFEAMRTRARDYTGPASDSIDEAQRFVVDRVKARPVTAAVAGVGVGLLLGLILASREK
jgi:ElaB/YqjD/DUF883 family membrane-anchored ribosome-binding protein